MRTLVGVMELNKGDWGASGAEASVVKPTLGLAGDVPISLWAATRKLYSVLGSRSTILYLPVTKTCSVLRLKELPCD